MTDTVYSSHSELQHPSRFFGDAWRDLQRSPAIAWQLFRSNLQARHRRAWLGYLWLLLPTLGATAVWVYVQSQRIIAIAPTRMPYLVFALSGTILWQVFAEALNAPLQQLSANRQLITRSRVPHEAVVLAGIFETLLNCAVRLVILAAVLLFVRMPVAIEILLVPIGVLALAALGVALGLLATPLGLLYDDISRALTIALGFWFFLTPVVYPTPARGLLRFNPVTPLLDVTRQWMTSAAPLDRFVLVTAITVATLLVAWILQRLARPHVVARLG